MTKFVNDTVFGFYVFSSSIYKWGDQFKTTKRKIRNYMILELYGTKKLF